jgi:hypothetical protein
MTGLLKDLAALAAVALAVTGFAMLAYGFNPPPCEQEDSSNCYWDAQTRGNGHGRSFVDVAGLTIPLF